jgi:hypothetical protein
MQGQKTKYQHLEGLSSPLTRPAATTAGRLSCNDRADMLPSVEYVGIWAHVSTNLNPVFKGGRISEIGIKRRIRHNLATHIGQD